MASKRPRTCVPQSHQPLNNQFLEPRDYLLTIAAQIMEYAQIVPTYSSIRKAITPKSTILHIGPLTLNTDTRMVHHEGSLLNFTPKEVALLVYLARDAGCLVDRYYIMINVWGQSPDVSSHAINTAVNRIRSILRKRDLEWMLETVKGQGYILHAIPRR